MSECPKNSAAWDLCNLKGCRLDNSFLQTPEIHGFMSKFFRISAFSWYWCKTKQNLGFPPNFPARLWNSGLWREKHRCRSSVLFPAGLCGKNVEVIVHIRVQSWSQDLLQKCLLLLLEQEGWIPSVLFSDICTFGFALWWLFVSNWHFSWNRTNPMDYCLQNLVLLNALRAIPGGGSHYGRYLTLDGASRTQFLGAAAQRVLRAAKAPVQGTPQCNLCWCFQS